MASCRLSLVLLGVLSSVRGESSGDCKSSPIINTIDKLFNVSDPEALIQKFIAIEQNNCALGDCPKLPIPACDEPQSLDDVECSIPVYSGAIKIGTDLICNTGCDDWPCKVACDGIDVLICETSDLILCKVGCLGIPSCVHACEDAIYEPCKQALVKDCSDQCEAAFNDCHEGCERELSLQVDLSMERLSGIISSMAAFGLDLNCTGDGFIRPLKFDGATSIQIDGLGLDMKLYTKDIGISSTQHLVLENLKMTLGLPFSGVFDCVRHSDLSITIGDVAIEDFDLNADLQLDKGLEVISDIICLGLPFCEDFLKDAINSALKGVVVNVVPGLVAQQIAPLLNDVLGNLTCPDMGDVEPPEADAVGVAIV